ncbi:MAG: PKD domain-containing protein [Flavobacteriales bacterium]|nr:PKD domain-containing protein [Flavobacteriales bacterium]
MNRSIANRFWKATSTTLLLVLGMTHSSFANLSEVIRFHVDQENYSDETVIRFLPDATTTFDNAYDALKLFSSNKEVPFLFSHTSDSVPLSINALPLFAGTFEGYFTLQVQKAGVLDLSWEILGAFEPGTQITIEDVSTHSIVDINNASSYHMEKDAGFNRFKLIINQPSTPPTIVLTPIPGDCDHDGSLEVNTNLAPVTIEINQNGFPFLSKIIENTGTATISNIPLGSYEITATMNGDEIKSETLTFEGPARPISEFSWSIDGNGQPKVGTLVHFEDLSFQAVSVQWDFSDGSTSTDNNPYHAFNDPGTYAVTLTASNGFCSQVTSQELTIWPGNGASSGKEKHHPHIKFNNRNRTVFVSNLTPDVPAELFLCSMTGSIIKTVHIMNDGTITLDAIPGGLYILQVRQEQQSSSMLITMSNR